MTTSLFVEEQANGIAFYINGELQFHSADEAIYHEYLAIPAIALAAKRFPNQALRVLICGGGDGLAARDVLRFPQVSQIDLVDYSQEVIDLAKSTFADFNQDSLVNPKVNIHIHEAFALLNQLGQEFCIDENHKYHAIICDFTYPNSIVETQIYTLEWFALLKQALVPSGAIATNAVSPDRNTLGFWCIYQTMQASGLQVKPLQLQIPSFINHDYGNWGFLLASETAITCSEIRSLDLPPELRSLNLSDLQLAFIFDQAIANARHSVVPHQQNSSQLMFYLLNRLSISNIEGLNLEDLHTSENLKIYFLNLQEVPSEIISNNFDLIYDSPKTDPMSLESLAQSWLRQIESNPNNLLIPAQHHSHTPEVAQVWLGRAKQLLTQIDFSRLIAKLLERSTELPQEIIADLHTLQTNFAHFQQTKQSSQQEALEKIYAKSAVKPSFNLTAAKVIAILSLTLLVANLAAPDAVFAKGSTSSFVGSSSSDDGSGLGFLGMMMTVGGIFWLINLYNDPNQK